MEPELWGNTVQNVRDWSLDGATWGLKLAWMQAIALAWESWDDSNEQNPSFKRQLLENPRKVFADHLNFQLPSSINVRVHVEGTNLPEIILASDKAVVILVLPKPPANISMQATALAEYSQNMLTCPFSTCC